jgi:ATP-dependent DNA ligase
MPLRPRALPAGFHCALPSRFSTAAAPSGKPWVHEIKHDGFRVIARKNGKWVRLYSRPGNDLTKCFPLIVDALIRSVHNELRRAFRLIRSCLPYGMTEAVAAF